MKYLAPRVMNYLALPLAGGGLAFLIFFLTPFFVNAQEDIKPLYEGLPFNRITLTTFYSRAKFDIQPIAFQNGVRPNPLPNSGKLTLRFVNNPLKEFQINWNFIERAELFSELVRDEFIERLKHLSEEAAMLSPNDASWKELPAKFDQMFEYLRFLEKYRGELSDYAETEQKFLFEEGTYRIKSKDFATGIMRLEAVFAQNPAYPGLENTWANALQTAMKDGEKAEYVYFLIRLTKAYPENSTAAGLMKRFLEKELNIIAGSKQAFEKKNTLSAHLLCEEALKSAAGLNELIQWFQRQKETGKKHSEALTQLIEQVAAARNGLNDWKSQLERSAVRIDVAVNCPVSVQENGEKPTEDPQDVFPGWATERCRRLSCRMIFDYIRPSLEGGVYTSPLGNAERILNGLRFTFAHEQQSAFHFSINDAAQSVGRRSVADVEVLSAEQLEIHLRHPSLIPEALFTVPLRTAAAPGGQGSYRWELKEPKRNGFRLADEKTEKDGSPNVIFEHTVFRSEEAIELLLNGKVDMIDRLAPWAVSSLKQDDRFTTGRYAVPTVYFLVPNLHKPLTASRTFRRALLYGLNRTGMLQRIIGNSGQGTVLSAPFIKGRSLGDPLGYGYDSLLEPRPYEPKLAIALSLLTFHQIRQRTPGWEEQTAIPEMVLAHPKNETAQYIALMIRRQWKAINIPVKVVEERDNEPVGRDENVDFWLVERCIKEPLVDAEKIFGRDGLCGTASPYMELALEKLRLAEDWATAGKELQNLHHLCFEETAVLPLWQLTEFYAHRTGITNVVPKDGLTDLYRNIGQWKSNK